MSLTYLAHTHTYTHNNNLQHYLVGQKISVMVNMNKKSMRKFSNWWHCLRVAIVDTFWEYTMHTRVSGMWMLRQNRTDGASRRCWSLLMITLLLCGIYLSLQLWLKFYSYPILNTKANDLPITNVAFPGITICSPKMLNMERVMRYIQTLDIPKKYDINEVAAGFEYFSIFSDENWVPANISSTAYLATDAVLRHNNITLLEAAINVSPSCEDFVQRCFWGAYEFPCRQDHEYLKFEATTAYFGPCCSFNYNPKNLSYVPFSSNIFGIDGGLTFMGVDGSERNISTGLIVLIHHPMDFISEATSSVTITSNSESFIEISPTVQSSSNEVLKLSESKRNCLISDDLALKRYRQASCFVACQAKVIKEKCKCQPYHLPIGTGEIECKLNDTVCYLKMYETLSSVRCDHCLPNCYDVTYSISAYKTDLLQHNYSISSLYSKSNFTKDSYIVRAYLAKQVVPVVQKVIIVSWIGLMSDLAGVFNLCMGIGLISIVEFFYYCIYRLRVNYKMRKVLLQ